jgi:hypothetical protein
MATIKHFADAWCHIGYLVCMEWKKCYQSDVWRQIQ